MGKRNLIKFLLIVIISVVVADIILGLCMRHYVKNNVLPGDYRSLDYLLKDFDDDVLILGSSVALNSLNPETIGDSLGVTAYNGASNAQTFTYQLVILKTLLNVHKPEVVLLGIKPTDFGTKGEGNRINFLSPYYGLGYEAIDSVLDNHRKIDKLLNKSSLYRFNTIWFRLLLYQFIDPGIKGNRGFIAKEVPSVPPTIDTEEFKYKSITEQRRGELEEFVNICKANGTKLVLFFPPQYMNYTPNVQDTELYKQVKRILDDGGMTLYDDTDLFIAEPGSESLFYDHSHLNIDGAKRYTDFFINRLTRDSIF